CAAPVFGSQREGPGAVELAQQVPVRGAAEGHAADRGGAERVEFPPLAAAVVCEEQMPCGCLIAGARADERDAAHRVLGQRPRDQRPAAAAVGGLEHVAAPGEYGLVCELGATGEV